MMMALLEQAWEMLRVLGQLLAGLLTVLTFVVAASALAVSAWQARSNARFSRLAQEADAFRHFNTRFAEIAKKRRELLAKPDLDEPGVSDLYSTYWSLQVEQWEYFTRRVISDDTYVSWLLNVIDTMRGRHVFAGFSSADAWERYGQNIVRNTPQFFLLAEDLQRLASAYAGKRNLAAVETLSIRRQVQALVESVRKLTADQALLRLVERVKQ